MFLGDETVRTRTEATLTNLLRVGNEQEPELPRKDFRELRVFYICSAGELETLCRNYSPGPGGKCSHRDFSFSELVICNKEDK